MSERELIEQLDHAIDAMLHTPPQKLSGLDSSVLELIAVAADLPNLPRADFKARLKNELEEEVAMLTAAKQATKNVNPVRPGFRTITPYLVVPDVHAEVQFLKETFGAEGQVYGLGSQGGFHG